MPGFATITLTAQAVKDRLTRQFGDESGVQITDPDIIRWINDGQRDIAARNGTIKAKAATNCVAGTKDYTIPNDVLKVISLQVNGAPVEYRSYQEAEEYILANDPTFGATGQPYIWYEWAGTYTLWPTPDTSYTNGLVIRYIQAPTAITALTDSLSIPDAEFNMLLQYVMTQAYEMDEDWQAAQVKAGQYTASLLESGEENDQASAKSYQRITVYAEDM